MTDVRTGAGVGDELAFQPSYSALLGAMTSEYVKKHLTGGGESVAPDD